MHAEALAIPRKKIALSSSRLAEFEARLLELNALLSDLSTSLMLPDIAKCSSFVQSDLKWTDQNLTQLVGTSSRRHDQDHRNSHVAVYDASSFEEYPSKKQLIYSDSDLSIGGHEDGEPKLVEAETWEALCGEVCGRPHSIQRQIADLLTGGPNPSIDE